eukprot:1156108-Pelagomonas_calceolata.AAC.8
MILARTCGALHETLASIHFQKLSLHDQLCTAPAYSLNIDLEICGTLPEVDNSSQIVGFLRMLIAEELNRQGLGHPAQLAAA